VLGQLTADDERVEEPEDLFVAVAPACSSAATREDPARSDVLTREVGKKRRVSCIPVRKTSGIRILYRRKFRGLFI